MNLFDRRSLSALEQWERHPKTRLRGRKTPRPPFLDAGQVLFDSRAPLVEISSQRPLLLDIGGLDVLDVCERGQVFPNATKLGVHFVEVTLNPRPFRSHRVHGTPPETTPYFCGRTGAVDAAAQSAGYVT